MSYILAYILYILWNWNYFIFRLHFFISIYISCM